MEDLRAAAKHYAAWMGIVFAPAFAPLVREAFTTLFSLRADHPSLYTPELLSRIFCLHLAHRWTAVAEAIRLDCD
eukprot:52566-Eustigmatos_ZCMA.PRE.1